MTEVIVKKLIKSKSGLRMVVDDEDRRSPFLIQEPLWVPDREATNCINCSVKFGFTRRKHHCRRCGLIYCGVCCETKLELPRMCFVDPVRVCINCETQTRSENKFFQQDIKFLTTGAIFLLRKPDFDDQLFHCKLSNDHRYLLFDGVDSEPLDISKIIRLNVSLDSESGRKRLSIVYVDLGETEETIYLDTTKDEAEKKTGTNWIRAFQSAHKLMEEPTLFGRI